MNKVLIADLFAIRLTTDEQGKVICEVGIQHDGLVERFGPPFASFWLTDLAMLTDMARDWLEVNAEKTKHGYVAS